MIVVLDNRDSFVHNLARYLRRLGARVTVLSSHGTDVAGIRALAPSGIVLSPGPCTPAEAGCSIDVVRAFDGIVPILGVCLGHQVIAEALGGRVVRGTPCHGRTSLVDHDGSGIFVGLPSPLAACRYHSLQVREGALPRRLRVTARSAPLTGGPSQDTAPIAARSEAREVDIVMAMADDAAAIHGVQFHPESILTEHGYAMLSSFLQMTGMQSGERPSIENERVADDRITPAWTMATDERVVTF